MKVVSAQQMRTIDVAATIKFGIPSLLLMENAGRSVADVAQTILKNKRASITIFCGYGNNGGDGFVVARHLANRAYRVKVFLVGKRRRMSDESRINLTIVKKMKIKIGRLYRMQHIRSLPARMKGTRLIIDAIFGIGVRGELNHFYCQLFEYINNSGVPVLSVDIPSGLNADTGGVISSAIQARTTAAMGLMKKGFKEFSAKKYLGKIVTADISLPAQLKTPLTLKMSRVV